MVLYALYPLNRADLGFYGAHLMKLLWSAALILYSKRKIIYRLLWFKWHLLELELGDLGDILPI
jgi:hypothetical protein